MADGTCAIPECDRPRRTRGWCERHYQRWYHTGDPLTPPRITPAGTHDLFFQLLHDMGPVYTGCIIWPFGLTGDYGAVSAPVGLAHRAALITSGSPRPSPPGDHALHSCDNPPCVNVRHLRWGTNRENVDDMLARNRQQRLSGEDKPAAKLTWEQVRSIRAAYAAGTHTKAALARQYGVAHTTIKQVINHATWKEENAGTAVV